jgi:ketosteroid isomerase-like protein
MSQESVNTVLAMNSAFNQGDMDRYFAFCDPEIEFHDRPGFPGPGVHRGQEAFRRHIEDYREAWVEARVETEEIRSVPGPRRPLVASSTSGKDASFAYGSSPTTPTPSKPPGWGSRPTR